MSLEKEELRAATNKTRVPGFLETSPNPKNFSEFSEAPKVCLHYNGQVLKGLESSQLCFLTGRQDPWPWRRDSTLGVASWSQEKGPLGHFNCLILGYRARMKRIRPSQRIENKALLSLQQRQPMSGATLHLTVLKERWSFLGLKKYSCNTVIEQWFPDP